MLIYHDPNTIIREAYQKILMGGGKHSLTENSSNQSNWWNMFKNQSIAKQKESNKTSSDNTPYVIHINNFCYKGKILEDVAKAVGISSSDWNELGNLYIEDLIRLFDIVAKVGYPRAVEEFKKSYYEDESIKMADYINQNKSKFIKLSDDVQNDNTPYIVDIHHMSIGFELDHVAEAVHIQDFSNEERDNIVLLLMDLFEQVAKVGYPRARAAFMGEWSNEDVIKMADYINQNKSKFMENKNDVQKRKKGLRNAYNQNLETHKDVQDHQNTLNNDTKNNVNGMSTNTTTNKNVSPTQPTQTTQRSSRPQQQNRGLLTGTTFIPDDDTGYPPVQPKQQPRQPVRQQTRQQPRGQQIGRLHAGSDFFIDDDAE